ncbi:hypothetical protein [Edaphobacter flagellatus]|uniref:hypothetical protein n=1 Tax=Edaphobacter flagellatus TaxID=1933044 RepID=UPI0021B38EFE|nr:hypothetical protein [Edaphobacter flagellatus]
MNFRKGVVSHKAAVSIAWIICSTYLVLFGMILAGCGSGSGNSSGNAGGGSSNTGDYSLSVQPTSVTLSPGGSQTVTVSIQAQNGFASNVNVSVTSLPAGVTASPSSFAISSATQVVTLTAAASAASVSNSIATIQGVSVSLSHQVQLTITVNTPASGGPSSRSKFLRTDSTTAYTAFPPPNWTVFHSPTRRFFASDPYTNHLNVIDSVAQKQIATLTIPGAFGMDLAPDGSVLYVGTMLGDLYVIDPVQLSVIRRYAANTISPFGFTANAVYALANGKLLLERYNLIPGYSWIDGNGPLALWNPADNSIVTFVDPGNFGGQKPEKPICLAGFEHGVLTNNRTRILLSPVQTSQGSAILCSFDPIADTWVWSSTMSDSGNSALSTIAVSPDGNTVAASTGKTVYVLDAATLKLKNSFPIKSTQSLLNYPSAVIGSDNQTLYISDLGSFVYAYNLSTGTQIGWLPNIQTTYSSASPNISLMQAISDNGLIAGVMDQGVALLDLIAINSSPVGTAFGPSQLSKAYGPANGGTQTSWNPSQRGLSSSPKLSGAFFGNNRAANPSISSSGNLTISATSPSGTPGPVDVITLTSDGSEQLLPEAFSYGPWVVEAPTAYATADGGGSAQIYGYGFGAAGNPSNQPVVAPPSDLQVVAGSGTAQVTGFIPSAYQNNFLSSPFPLVGVQFTVPPGTAGTASDITITNSAGSTSVKQAISYVPATKSFPVSDAKLVDGIYDPRRDVYYFTDTNQVRVFSRSQGAWLNPIVIPPPPKAYSSQRLLGIALSLDGSKMVVSDAGALAIYIIDPDNPASIKSYSVVIQTYGDPVTTTPSGVAITNSGTVYYTAYDRNGTGAPFLLSLDTTTGKVSPFGGFVYTFSSQGAYQYGRLPMSADGTRIYLNNYGTVAAFDTATGAVTYPFGTNTQGQGFIGQGGFEIVLAANQTSLFADGLMMDSSLNVLGIEAMNWREAFDATPVYGATMSPDGGLLFQPNLKSIDVFDGRTGAFRSRVSLPIKVSSSYRALVSDPKDSVQIAIVDGGAGIAIIDLGSIPEPDPIPFLRSISGPNPQIQESPAQPRRTPIPATLPRHRTQPLFDGSIVR